MDKIDMLIGTDHRVLIVSAVSGTVFLMCLGILILIIYIEIRNKSMNKNLCYQEELFNALGTNIEDVFIIYEVISKKYEYISPNFEKSIGISIDTLINNYLDLLKHIPAEARNEILMMIEEPAIDTMKEVEFEFVHPMTGLLHWMMIRVYPVFNKGKLFRYVACITNTTSEKQAQKALEEAMIKLQKSNEAKKEFLSHVSHEFKTPINAIIGMTQIATKSIEDKEKIGNCILQINFASVKLLEMINNILDISKIDSNKLILEHKPFSLKDFVTQYVQLVQIQMEFSNQEFIFDYKIIPDVYLLGDDLRILQVISNCMSNAIKFTPAGGKISFEVSETDRTQENVSIRFVIADTGKGMTPQYLERLFVPFEQEDQSIAEKFGGSGLGMSITRTLVDLMGGSIQVDSTMNVGTCITIDITFPISNELTQTAIGKNEIKIPSVHDYTGKRVLVVEDNEINQEIVSAFLKYINITVETASDGYEATKLFEASEPGYYDIILMDLIMPGIDGYETTKVIRDSSHPDANKICIIAMTADNFAEHGKSLECGMNYHITKPFNLDDFYDIISQVMDNN